MTLLKRDPSAPLTWQGEMPVAKPLYVRYRRRALLQNDPRRRSHPRNPLLKLRSHICASISILRKMYGSAR